MKIKIRSSNGLALIGLVAIVAVLLAGFACPQGTAYHKASRASKQIADDLHEFEVQVEAQCARNLTTRQCTGELGTQDAKNLAQLAIDATRANDVFIGRLQSLKTLDAANSSTIVAYVKELADSIQTLNANGVLHISNPKSQAKFALAYQSIETGLTTLQALLQGLQPAPAKSDNNNPFDPLLPLMAGIDAAGVALILSAFNSIAKLILQARADGSLTDDQLQAAGLAEDADTQNHAAAFIASIEGSVDTPPPAG